MPIGFKNGTDGNCQIAVDAITAASHGHTFAGTTAQGRMAVVQTSGNPSCHVILRGAAAGPNYEEYVHSTTGCMLSVFSVFFVLFFFFFCVIRL